MEATHRQGTRTDRRPRARLHGKSGANGAQKLAAGRPRRSAPPPAPASPPTSRSTPEHKRATGIDTHSDYLLLAALGVRCNGCGACSSACPSCHCFDIVDEEEGIKRGTRRRCWYTCQAPTFTLHASGHNPRDTRSPSLPQRMKQSLHLPQSSARCSAPAAAAARALPRRPGPGRDPAGDRHRRAAGGRRRDSPIRRSMNIYQPQLATHRAHRRDAGHPHPALEFKDQAARKSFDFQAGQFGEYSVFGAGESTFCIASSPTRRGFIECSFKAVGKVTPRSASERRRYRRLPGSVRQLVPGGRLEGQERSVHRRRHRPGAVRCVIWNVLDRRERVRWRHHRLRRWVGRGPRLQARAGGWELAPDVKIVTTVDPGGETVDWTGEVGYVTPSSRRRRPGGERRGHALRAAIVVNSRCPCSKARLRRRHHLHHAREPHEVRARQCGRCNIGPVYVCKDGPVFTAAQLKGLPAEY